MTEDASWWSQYGATVWGIVLGAAITVIVAVLIYQRQKRIKTLDWTPITNVPLLDTRATVANEFNVYWRNTKVSSPRILILRIQNTGREAIRSQDFEGNIHISFETTARVLLALISDTSPNLPRPSLIQVMPDEGRTNNLDVEPLLLNSGEWFDIQCLIDGSASYPCIECRFADQTREMKRGRDWAIGDWTKRNKHILSLDAAIGIIYGFLLAIILSIVSHR